ncbi:MAG TPA: nucleoside-diphosphate kinase [Patescibacteria group bacterium]|nr:nucleoside-diphosphate kinase [Patescibacteria group bacterium]
MIERTLVVFKPDAVMRGLTGEIITRFEAIGLKIIACKMAKADRTRAEKHYPADRESFLHGMGEKTLDNYQKFGVDAQKELGTIDTLAIGKIIRGWLVEYLTSAPVIALVIEGPHAVELVRKLCGPTLPLVAAPGTIRGDLCFDSSYLANTAKRAIKNLMHASGSLEEAAYEIPLWFSPQELHSYERVEEKVMK